MRNVFSQNEKFPHCHAVIFFILRKENFEMWNLWKLAAIVSNVPDTDRQYPHSFCLPPLKPMDNEKSCLLA